LPIKGWKHELFVAEEKGTVNKNIALMILQANLVPRVLSLPPSRKNSIRQVTSCNQGTFSREEDKGP